MVVLGGHHQATLVKITLMLLAGWQECVGDASRVYCRNCPYSLELDLKLATRELRKVNILGVIN